MKQITDAQVIAAIKAKMGYQTKIVYCKDCVSSIPNPDLTNRPCPLMCIKVDIVHFPTAKMRTCSVAVAVKKGSELTEGPPSEDPPGEDPEVEGNQGPWSPDPDTDE
jgi:hypothetical protein